MDVTMTAFARGGVSGLASLPQVLLKLLEIYDDGGANRRDLARIIAKDPALSAKVLALGCVADLRSHRGEGITLQQALGLISVDSIKSIAIGASGHQILLRYGSTWHSLLHGLWLRALTCAHLAELLADLADYPTPREAYLGGLFHNVGQLALGAYAPELYPNLLGVALDGPKLAQLEIRHFNMHHYEVGADLIASWKLQSFIGDAVRYQAEPADKLRDAHPLVRIVNLARGLSAADADDCDHAAAGEAAENLLPNMQPGRLRALAHQAVERVAEDAEALEIPLRGDGDLADINGKAFELANRIRDIAILDGVSQPLTPGQDQETLARAVRCGAEILVGADTCELLVYDAAQDVLAGVGPSLAAGLKLPVARGGSLPAKALTSGQILQSTDGEANDTLVVADRQLLKLLEAHAMLCVPLALDDAKAGVMVLGIDQQDLPYPEERMTLLRQLGRRAAAAIISPPGQAGSAGQGAAELFEQHVRQSVHEARNPLTTVKNYVQILGSKHEDEAWAQRDLKIIGEEIERIDGILRRLSEISQTKKNVPGAVSVNGIIADMAWLQQTSTLEARHIRVTLDLADDMPLLAIDPDGFKQVITNLVNNAADAMPGGGEITIRTRAGVNVNGHMYGELSVHDTGDGIARDLIGTLFERGTSVKGEGHGLGLAIVAELVESWRGWVSCRTEPGEGTIFHVLLPYRLAAGREAE
ncbi:MAG TPA: HDOD domain-containing protein [Gammaproteobacteria bacterium]|nr:HDOD domain-containing protein [Gammaproteobacteria bacterium]